MRDRDVILGLLRRVARRLWVNRAIQEIGFGACIALFSLVAFELVRPAFAAATRLAFVALAAALVGFEAYAVRQAMRPTTLARAAGVADTAGRLKDELKSAYWFIVNGEASSFADVQVGRAATTARRLDPAGLAPARVPRNLVLGGALAVLLGLTLLAPRMSDSREFPAIGSEPEQDESPARLLAMLEDAPREPAVDDMMQALSALERKDASRESLQHALAQARDAADAANLRAAAALDTMARLAGAMKAHPALSKAAQELQEGRTREAMRLVGALAREQREGAAAEGEEILAAQAGRTDTDAAPTAEDLARDLGRTNAAVDKDTIVNLLKSIEDARNAMEVQSRVNQARRRMEDFLVAASQASALVANRFGAGAAAPNATPAPETGNADLRGGTMFRSGAIARGDEGDKPQESSRTGSASGHSAALAVQGARSERLDAKLKLEAVRSPEMSGDKNEDGREQPGWFYRPSRAEAARASFAEVRAGSYAGADVLSPQRIPMRQQRLVKDYFIHLHQESEKK